MNIKVNAKENVKELKNFWNNIHFHPTDAVEDEWGQRVLENVYKDKVAKYIRLHSMFEDIVTRGEDGKLKYDYTESDVRTDYMVEHGFNLLICFDFMPLCLASDPLHSFSGVRYKDKRFNYSKPNDYKEWQEVCSEYTRHLIERYGEDVVSNWYFHCWNEPDSGYWINSKGNDAMDADGDMDKIEEYIKLYDYFEQGVTSVCDKIKIGGPSCAGSDRFIKMFIEHTINGVHSVTGKKGVRCDFFSIHCYSQGIYSGLPNKTYTSPDNIMQRLNTIYKFMEEFNATDKEIVFDEWGICGGGFIGIDKDPRMIFRENEYYPAFYARLIDLMIRKNQLNISLMMICLSGQHEGFKDFDGYRSFFTINGFKKPIYNAYAMFAKLGDKLLKTDFNAENEFSGIVPTIDGDGNVKILLYHHADVFDSVIPNEKIKLDIEGLEGKYLVNHYRIDKNTSNSFAKWSEFGRPEMPTFPQREKIRAAGELSLYYPSETVEVDGKFSEEVVMTQNSVSLIELIKL